MGKANPVKAGTSNGPQMDLGIQPAQRKAIAEGLAKVLADTYTLYVVPQNT
jgi:starvation-inducible DNA-binding protein